MPSTFSTNLGIELITTGEQAGTWGATTNTNLGTLIEQAISGYVAQVITDGADTVITIPSGSTGVARNMTLELTGALSAARNLVVPSNRKLYFVYNNTTGGYAVTVKVSGQTGVSVPNGAKVLLVNNGTDVVNAVNYIPALYFSAGTAAAPSISTIGDTNTGIYFPAADTLAFSEGGVEAMRIDSSGNLGIATTTPTAKLHIGGAAAGTKQAIFTTGPSDFNFRLEALNGDSGTATGTLQAKFGLRYDNGTTNVDAAAFRFYRGAGSTDGSIAFVTNNIERATLDSSGNVSFASPSYRIGYSLSTTTSTISGASTPDYGIGMGTYTGFTGPGLGVSGYYGLMFATAGLERMRVTNAGFLGIGVTTPSTVLHVRQDTTAIGDPALSSGEVARFQRNAVQNSPASISIISGNTNNAALNLGDSDSSAMGRVLYDHSVNGLALYSNGSERVRIDSAGQVGVGTTSPAGSMEILNGGNLYVRSGKTASVTTTARLLFGAFSANPLTAIYGFSDSATNNIVAVGGGTVLGEPATRLAFYTGAAGTLATGTERMRIDVDGNVGIGTTSPPVKLSLLSNVSTNDVSTPLVMLGSDRTDRYASINSVRGSASTYLGLSFSTSNNAAPAEVMRLDSSGNLGLGVTPSAWSGGFKPLQILSSAIAGYDSGVGNIQTEINTNAYQSSLGTYTYVKSYAALQYRQVLGQGHSWFNAPSGTAGNTITFTQAMTLDASGKLGINTTSPTSMLDVSGINTGSTYESGEQVLTLRNTSTSSGARGAGIRMCFGTSNSGSAQIDLINGSTGQEGSLSFGTRNSGGTLAERARITSGGNLLIGTTTAPQINGKGIAIYDTSFPRITLRNSDSGDGTGDGFQVVLNGVDVDLANYETGAIKFFTNGASERARITSDGNFLIGTTNTSTLGTNTKLKTGPTASFGGITANVTTAVDTGISINQSTCGGCIVLIASRNTGTGLATEAAVYIVRFYYDGNNAPTTVYVGGSSNFVTFGTSVSNTLTVTNASGGNVNYSWFGNK